MEDNELYTHSAVLRFQAISLFYLWVNTFYLTLSIGLSSCAIPKRKRTIEKNEDNQEAGKVNEMQQLNYLSLEHFHFE